MTTIDHANQPASRDRVDAFGFVKSAIRLVFHALKIRSERAALHGMPDHLLKDIGIGRSEINHVTSNVVYDCRRHSKRSLNAR
ncbi:DUF1127 domain-containing protein [Mesorhizobium sophorae]|uniref:DUF1127 domain-containing protein n=1 Tax=Mesorhizobium sophorae TaxID=1300294 RepID=UPI00142E33D2|nr:DUF1127 domain-containing protein [Mesorhizobium sophorae]